MSLSGRKILFHLCIAFLLILPQNAISQSDPDESAVKDISTAIDNGSRHSLYAGGGYGSNMIYLGSTISGNQPYGYTAFSYGFKSSLYLTVSAVHLTDHNPYAAFMTGTISFSHTFNSWFDISASASKYHVAPSLRETLFNNFYYGDLTIGVDWKILYTKISAGVLYMDESSMYYQARNSRYFTTPAFFKKKAYISFDPYVNVLLGTLTTIEFLTDTITQVTVNYPFFPASGGTGNGSGNGFGSGSGTGSSSTTGTTTTTTTTSTVTSTVLSSRFGIMEIDIGLPIAFNTRRLTVEAEPGYVIPMYNGSPYAGAKGFIFMLNCYIKIF